jgi:NADPH-dependent 2,4-dienoyl-CoA reductase/sulfur reductase-like enzyme
LRGKQAWTLLTTLQELKGFEESRDEIRRSNDPSPPPFVLIVGGGQGGIALAARLKRLGVPAAVVEKNARAGDLLAQALRVTLPARPGVVRPHAVPAVSRLLAGVHAQGAAWATGSRCT